MTPRRAVRQDDFVNGWYWANQNYKHHAGDGDWLIREALRRAVDIRDRWADGEELSARPLMMVDVLNMLKDAIGLPPEATGAEWLWDDIE